MCIASWSKGLSTGWKPPRIEGSWIPELPYGRLPADHSWPVSKKEASRGSLWAQRLISHSTNPHAIPNAAAKSSSLIARRDSVLPQLQSQHISQPWTVFSRTRGGPVSGAPSLEGGRDYKQPRTVLEKVKLRQIWCFRINWGWSGAGGQGDSLEGLRDALHHPAHA